MKKNRTLKNPYRIEPLDDDELAFLSRRYKTESRQFYTGMRWLLLLILVMPLTVLLLHHYYDIGDNLSFQQIWLYAQLITLCLFCIAFVAGYLRLMYPYERDLKHKNKIVETVLIERKRFMAENSTYHLYINSEPTYTIEVSQDTYNTFNVNDEINIEYTQHSEIYLGYF